MDGHEEWVRQIEAEIEGELSLAERAALARHLAACPRCAGARASHLELRAALAAATGDPHARALPVSKVSGRSLVFAVVLALIVGLAAGWFVESRILTPGPGSLEGSRATLVAP
jgi:hypothetical protein